MAALLSDLDVIKLLAAHGLANATTGQPYPPRFNCLAKTADYVIKAADPCGTLFHTTGAGGAVIFTLPAASAVAAGTFYLFMGGANNNFSVVAPTVDTLVTLNDLTADSVICSTSSQKIGALMLVFSNGTSWFHAGIGVGAAYTVVT